MPSISSRLLGKLRRSLVLAFASMLMLGVSLPAAAQAAATPAASAVPSAAAPSMTQECRSYSHNHGNYHYYRYCYDYSYRQGKRWYDSFELYYWYRENGHLHYGSCDFRHNFGYHHPSGPWRDHCPSH